MPYRSGRGERTAHKGGANATGETGSAIPIHISLETSFQGPAVARSKKIGVGSLKFHTRKV
jgi:hypothetical protein